MSILDQNVTSSQATMGDYGVDDEEIKRRQEEAKEAAKRKQEEIKAKETEAQENAKPVPNPIVEAGTAVIGGVGDFVEDAVPFLDIPDNWSPQNHTGWGKALRRMSSVLIPSIGLSLLTKKGVGKIVGPGKMATMPKTAKYFGELGVDAAAGVAVDAISRESEDDNLARTLRDTLGWQLPDDITTLDTDSPDVKRQKNIIEGAGMGLLIDGIGWAVKGVRSLRGSSSATKIIPEDQAAKEFEDGLNGVKPKDDSDLEQVVTSAEDARDDVRFRRGLKDLEDDPDGLMPTPDVNTPLYDAHEQAVIARPRDAARQNDIDNARIVNNIDTVDGRMGPVMDSADYREANAADTTGIAARKRLVAEQKVAGVYTAETMNGRRITHQMIMDAKDEDLKTFFKNPDDNTFNQLKKDLEETKVQWLAGVKSGRLDAVGLPKAVRAARFLIDAMDPDNLRASGRLQRTTAGQIADSATAIRQMADAGLDTSRQEQLQLEMLEHLSAEIKFASYTTGRGLQLMDVMKKASDNTTRLEVAKQVEEAIKKTKVDAKKFAESLGKLRNEDPSNFKALMAAYEATDGKVDTIADLNRWGEQTLSISAAAFKAPGQAPSIFAKGLSATFFNSLLSATVTPLKAWAGNFINTALKNASYTVGARLANGMKGNKYHMKRGAVAFGAQQEALANGWQHAWSVWKQSVKDPNSVKYAAREEVVEQNQLAIKAAEAYAKAQAEMGNYAPMLKFRTSKWLIDINNWVGLRYSTNAMTAGDAFTRAVVATNESRARAYDELFQKNPNRMDFSEEEIKQVADRIRKDMFGDDGFLTDEAVEQTSRELTLNLDSAASRATNEFLEMVPILRTLVTFPRTSLNALNFALNSSRVSTIVPWMTDVKKILRADETKDLSLAKEIMQSKGKPFSSIEWDAMVLETKGRLAIGDMVTYSAITAAVFGHLTGNGPKTEKERRAWQKLANFQPRSIKLGDLQVSYDAFEPFSTYLAIIADVVQFAGDMPSMTMNEIWDSLSMTVSVSLTDKTMLAGLQPLMDMLSGNQNAASKWLAQSTNALIPYSGLRNQMGQIMNPGLREIEYTVGEFMRNRNSFLDSVDPEGALPFAYDPFNGSKVRDVSPFQRFVNYATPFRFNETAEPHRRWLMEIGFDQESEFKTNKWGKKFTPSEQSMLAKIMGEQGFLDKEIKKLYKDKGLRNEQNFYAQQRAQGTNRNDLPDEQMTFRLISRAFSRARDRAEAQMYSMPEFQLQKQEGIRARYLKGAQKRGDIEAIQQILSIPK